MRDTNPDGLILISYYSDGALIARQARQVGLKQVICAASSVYSPKFIELGGDAVEGVHVGTRYFPEDPRPEVRKFIAAFKAKYGGQEPDSFNAYSYDAMNMAAAVLRIGGTDRKAIRDAFAKVKDVPSVLFGTVKAKFTCCSGYMRTRTKPIDARIRPSTTPMPASRQKIRHQSPSLSSPVASPRITSVEDCEPELPPALMSSGT